MARLRSRPRTATLFPNCTVGFVYNEPCPLKCDFCCHTKENVGPGHLNPQNTAPLLLEYAKNPRVTRFAFTGGDPFIYVKDIIQIMQVARISGVDQPFHIVTSGFWAKNDEIVDQRLSILASLGMDLLYVSYDLEHQKWVPEEYVYRIDRFCNKYGITLSVYGVFWQAGFTVRQLLPDLKTQLTNETLVAPIGRARERQEAIPRPVNEASLYSCGRPHEYDITIYPNGETYPCCSGGFNKEGRLLLGNSFRDSADAIIDRCFRDFYVIIAKELGFNKLYETAKNSGFDMTLLPDFNTATSVCEICSKIHSDNILMNMLKYLIENMEIEYCIARLGSLESSLPDTDKLDVLTN